MVLCRQAESRDLDSPAPGQQNRVATDKILNAALASLLVVTRKRMQLLAFAIESQSVRLEVLEEGRREQSAEQNRVTLRRVLKGMPKHSQNNVRAS